MATATLHGAPRRRVIVGVLGPTFHDFDGFDGCDDFDDYDHLDTFEDEYTLDHASNEVLRQAERVAVTLTDLQHIVLTSGSLSFRDVSVRCHALRAAERSGKPHAIARCLGIVPIEISDLIPVDYVIIEKVESDRELALYLHSMLAGAEHDRIIAMAADVLIALPG